MKVEVKTNMVYKSWMTERPCDRHDAWYVKQPGSHRRFYFFSFCVVVLAFDIIVVVDEYDVTIMAITTSKRERGSKKLKNLLSDGPNKSHLSSPSACVQDLTPTLRRQRPCVLLGYRRGTRGRHLSRPCGGDGSLMKGVVVVVVGWVAKGPLVGCWRAEDDGLSHCRSKKV